MRLLGALVILLHQLWIVVGSDNVTSSQVLSTSEPETKYETIPLWCYFIPPIGVMVIMIVTIILYNNRKRRAMRRRQRTEDSKINITAPIPGTVSSLTSNARVNVVAVTRCTTGKPQLKSKMMHTFNDAEENRRSFENVSINNNANGGTAEAKDVYYVNARKCNYDQNACTSVSRSNLSRSYNISNTGPTTGRNENAPLKRKPFIPPTISLELTNGKHEKNYETKEENRRKKSGARLPSWESSTEQQIYENQNSGSVFATGKSPEHFRAVQENVKEQHLYVNNNKVSFQNEKQWLKVPELPLKQRVRNTMGLDQTGERSKSPDYENFGGDNVNSSWQKEINNQKYKNKSNLTVPSQTSNGSDLNHDGKDYENLPTVGGKLLSHSKVGDKTTSSCGSLAANKTPLLDRRRPGGRFARDDRKAVRRSKSNFDAFLNPSATLPQQKNRPQAVWQDDRPRNGQIVFESRENLGEDHQTNTESLMHMLGLSVSLNNTGHESGFQMDDNYLPMDDYDDNCV